jgi:hypothetical protein
MIDVVYSKPDATTKEIRVYALCMNTVTGKLTGKGIEEKPFQRDTQIGRSGEMLDGKDD